MQSIQSSRLSRGARVVLRPRHRHVAAAGTKQVNAAATSVIPISEVQVEQPTGFLASLQQMFSKKEESHEEEHAHAHVMFHSHIAEMLAMEAPKEKKAVPASASVAKDHEEAPHFHDDHGHSHVMFHSHIAEAKAFE